jgi:flagellar basal-body rod protein FlgC
MAIDPLQTSVTALRTNQFRLDVSANNVANINTDDFRASIATTADNAYINSIGTGTQVTGTYAPPRPAAPTVNPAAGGGETGAARLSNTDLATEMTNQMNFRNAYAANTVMGRTAEDVSRTLMDLVG